MKIGQWRYPEQGLIEAITGTIYSVNIYSCPGNQFLLDNNKITINNYGNFTMDFGDNPITKIGIVGTLNVQTIPTIIEYYYS